MIRTRTAYQYAQGQATWRIESTGDGTGVSTLRMKASEDTTLRLTDNAKFYTDSAGTLGESSTWTITAGALQTIYLKCTSGSARLIIPQQRLITEWGNSSGAGWISSINAAQIVSEGFPLRNLTSLRIEGNASFKGALPVNLTYLRLHGNSINWTYSGALPVNLTYLLLYGNSINWTYSGALPVNLISLIFEGNNINWTYSGALPVNLIYLWLYRNSINWTHTGALPVNLIIFELYGEKINWTYYDVSGNKNISNFNLGDFVTTSMTASQLITLLQSMANRVGDLPATCTINDYSNSPTAAEISAATPNETGTDAEQARYWINQIIANKKTTEILLMGVSIT